MNYRLLVRRYPHGKFVSCWLVTQNPAGRQSFMWGELLEPVALDLAKELGLDAEFESSPLSKIAPQTPPCCTPLAQQKLMFE